MSGSARALLTGVMTVFTISIVGFGIDSMLADSPVKQPSGYQPRLTAQDLTPVRVILPASAEPARPPEPSKVVVATSEVQSPTEPEKLPAPRESKVEGGDDRGAAAEKSRRRHLERKSRMNARAAQQMRQLHPETAILAFDGGEPSRRGSYGN